jgi:hypothetical protein
MDNFCRTASANELEIISAGLFPDVHTYKKVGRTPGKRLKRRNKEGKQETLNKAKARTIVNQTR